MPDNPENSAPIASPASQPPGCNSAPAAPLAPKPIPHPLAPNRQIFRYFDGEKKRGIDPLLALRRIANHPTFNPERDWPLATAKIPDYESLGTVVDGVRDVFEVAPWSEDESGLQHGLTDTECITLYVEFATMMDGLKKNGAPSPTGPPPTDQPACQQSSQTTPMPSTNASSGCG